MVDEVSAVSEGTEEVPPWLRDPLPGEPGHEDTPFPPPPLPPGWEG